jgi:hypothetical protein
MLRLVALTCLLLLAMLRFLDGSGEITVEGPMSADVNVAPGAVNTGCGATFGAIFEVRSDDAASTVHDGPAAIKTASTASHALIFSALNSVGGTEISCSRMAGTTEAFLASRLISSQA